MTVKKLLFVFLLALLLLPSSPASAQPPEIERAWGNDGEWEMLIPVHQPALFPSNMKSHAELWVIGAIDDADPQSPGHDTEIGAHDHVIYVPPGNKGEYTAIWHVIALVPGPSAIPGVNVNFRIVVPPGVPLVYQVNYGAGWVNLTSAETVEAAVDAGLLTEIDTGIAFLCPARPIKP